MFQFRRFPTYSYVFTVCCRSIAPAGFPIRKSTDIADICSSPWLIAACHVLLRLLMPRHSPCALCSLTFMSRLVNPPLRHTTHHYVSASRQASLPPRKASWCAVRLLRVLGASYESYGQIVTGKVFTSPFAQNCFPHCVLPQ